MGALILAKSGSATTDVTQNNITVTFNGAPVIGQFWNGDYYCVGPCRVNSYSPAWDGTKNGAMLNPAGGGSTQGYDTRPTYTYSNGVRAAVPIDLAAGDSLVISKGRASLASGGANEALSDALVITCLASAPASPSTTFRPGYVSGASKTLKTFSDVNYGLVPIKALPSGATNLTLGVPSGNPSYNYVEITDEGRAAMNKVWLDHGDNPTNGASIHPTNNMPPYPRDSSTVVSRMALKMMINDSERTETINRMVQLGIDLYPISLTNVEGWKAYGGFGSGRKWPIIFAGLVLGDSSMQSPPLYTDGTNTLFKFGEDGHTYQGVSQPLFGRFNSEGTSSPYYEGHDYRDPNGLCESDANTYRGDLGMYDGTIGVYQGANGGYRTCCTSHTWVGSALAARLMSAVTLWNHTPFFDYMDRWVAEPNDFFDPSTAGKIDAWGYGGTQSEFMKKMWTDYR